MPFPILGWVAIAVGTAAVGYLLSDSDNDSDSSQVDRDSAEKERTQFEKDQKQEGFNSAIKQLWNDYSMDQDISLNSEQLEVFMKSKKKGLARLKDAFSLDSLGTDLGNKLERRIEEIDNELENLYAMHEKYSSVGAK